ncbi:MAG: LAGLIDADG family homing endonuclease [Sulfurifustaceae bacterium]
MAAYRQTRTLTPQDAAYIAGIIDGEGTISLSRRHRNDNRQLVVSIASTERELLEYILQTVGAGRITKKRTASANHSPSATYVVDNRQAHSLLQQVAPYLRTYKAKRAELVLQNYLRLTPRNGKYSPTQQREREAFVTSFFQLQPGIITR